jgi:alpha-glucosidase
LVFNGTGIEVYKEFEVSIFPNPTKDLLNIHFDKNKGEVSFKLYDLNGRLLIAQKLSSNQSVVSLEKVPQGLYIYEVSSGEKVRRGKVVKN